MRYAVRLYGLRTIGKARLRSIPHHLVSWRSASELSDFPETVVFGATGRLGGVLRDVWPTHWPVTWVARRRVPGPNIVVCDPLREAELLRSLVGGAEVVLSLLGSAPGGGLQNVAGLEEHAPLARAVHGAARGPVLLASSAAVYGRGGELGLRLSENARLPKDVSLYGAAKRSMEAATDACALRIGNVAGFDAILGGWQPGFELDSFPDGSTPQRSYIGPVTLALALADLCRKAHKIPAVLNVAEAGAIEMSDLLVAAGRSFERRPAPPAAISRVELDTKAVSGFVPQLENPGEPSRMVAEFRWLRSLQDLRQKKGLAVDRGENE